MRFSDLQKLNIVQEYIANKKITCAELARKYNCTTSNIWALLKRRKIKTRKVSIKKYSINENYFEKIDTEAKAYFLGLLYADGYNNEKKGLIALGLISEDREILEKFNKEIDSNRPIMNISLKKGRPQNRLVISNKKMSSDLSKLGCFQAKSLTLKFPTEKQVPKEFIKEFIRGYMDGDGSFGKYKEKKNGRIRACFCIVSTIVFCKKIQKITNNMGIRTYLQKRHKERDTTTIQLKSSGKINTMLFLDWLYKDATIYLKRKYDKYLKIKESDELANQASNRKTY